MPDSFSVLSSDDIGRKYKTIVSYKDLEYLDDEDSRTHLSIVDVEEPEYQHIKDQFFIVDTEAFEEQTSNKAEIEVTEYENVNQFKIELIKFI
ncbi:hypothetical protein [Alkalibacterium indicireducens]|uniref:Uncharacterized protein n=1 Tax=Alkalibacterium indicireducens TaxID=398758 RepID=A0ABN1AKR7_9LACT